MTVEQVAKDGWNRDKVWVSWFDVDHKKHSDTFAPEAVELATPATK